VAQDAALLRYAESIQRETWTKWTINAQRGAYGRKGCRSSVVVRPGSADSDPGFLGVAAYGASEEPANEFLTEGGI
jgi:hypothetical protein